MKLYYEDSRSPGTPLLLIAGLASDAVSWIFQREPLQQSHRVIACDNRGVARSPKPPGPYTIAEMADDLLELLDHLELPQVAVLGHSLGGAIAQHLALHQPQRVSRLILACTGARFSGRTLAIVESWSGCLALGGGSQLLGRCLFPWLYTKEFLDQPGALEACIEALENHPYALEAAPIAAQVEALRAHDLRAQLSSLNVPTLVLGAEQDLLATPEDCRQLHRLIPASQLKILDYSGHSCMLQTPQAFNQAVLEFLSGS